MGHFQHKRCLVTGAASGIGRALAEQLGAAGAVLILTDVQQQALADTVAALRAEGVQVALAQPLDISDADAVQQLADAAHAEGGALDMLFNVAGISIWGEVGEIPLAMWRQLLDINLMGPVHVLHSFLPAMIARGSGGQIVNVSSAAGLFGLPWHAAYSATKFGLRGISEVLRYDLQQHGIGVSLVCPGGVDTGLVRTLRIVGVDRDHPEVIALTQRFQRHAVTPAVAAARILRGVRRKRFWIYTSADVRFGFWVQRKWAWPYQVAMGLLNRYISRRAAPARRPPLES